MSAELMYGKILTPFWGGSLHVWTVTLAAVLTGMSLGYAVGARLGRSASAYWILPLLTALWLQFTPWLAPWLLETGWTLHPRWGLLLPAFVLMLPPFTLLAALSPWWIGQHASDDGSAGKSTGQLLAVSTLGGVAGTFLCGFWLLPAWGVPGILALLVFLLAALALSLLLLRENLRPRMLFPAALLLLNMFLPHGDPVPPPAPGQASLLARHTGLLGEMIVADIPLRHMQRRILLVNRISQTLEDPETGCSRWDYPHYLAAMSGAHRGTRALLLGLGGGSVARELDRLGASVTAVDIDPRTADMSRQYFRMPASISFVTDDARHFLNRDPGPWDLIVADLFSGESPPAHVLTQESFTRIRSLLSPAGRLLINFHGYTDPERGQGARALLKTLQSAGMDAAYVLTEGNALDRNALIISTPGTLPWQAHLPTPCITACCQQRHMPDSLPLHRYPQPELDAAPLLTDDRPILDRLNEAAYREWRAYAVEHYILALKRAGIPYL